MKCEDCENFKQRDDAIRKKIENAIHSWNSNRVEGADIIFLGNVEWEQLNIFCANKTLFEVAYHTWPSGELFFLGKKVHHVETRSLIALGAEPK